MEFSLDVEALRSQFPLGVYACERDSRLVPRLFDYLDQINREKLTHISQRGSLNRMALRAALGIRNSPRWWPPLLTEIVHAADKQLQDQMRQRKPVRSATRELCKRMRHWVRAQVNAGTLPLNHWGYLNFFSMSKAIGCTDNVTQCHPVFRRHVDRINRILEKQANHPKNSPFHCYIEKHKRFWNFEIAGSLDHALGVKIIECWRKRHETLATGTALSAYRATLIFLQFWVDKACSDDPRFASISLKLMDGKTPDHGDMLVILSEFREHVMRDKDWRDVSITNCFSHVNGLFAVLNREGVLPQALELRLPRREWRKDSSTRRPKLSLAEVPSSRRPDDEVIKLIEPLLSERLSKDEIVELTRADFLKTLVAEGIKVTSSREDHVKLIGDLNRKRLADLRRCAENELLECWETYQRGQKLLAECDLSYQDDMEPLVQEWLLMSEKTQGGAIGQARLARLIFDEAADKDTKIARYLCLCEGRWDGFVPAHQNWELNRFHHRAHMKVGGRPLLVSMMQPPIEAYIATMVILLIDTGANVDVIHTLPFPCLADRDDLNEKIISGWKPRAGNAIIQNIIKVNDGNRVSSVRAIEMMEEMTSRLRRMAEHGPTGSYRNRAFESENSPGTGKPHHHLFISRLLPSMPLRVFGTTSRCKNFKAFLRRHLELEHLDLRLENIRSSVLLDVAIRKEGRLIVGQTISNHKSRDTQGGYVNKYVQHVLLEQSIRKFQTLLEAVLIADIPSGHEKLGISEEEFREALNEAHRTGLGVMCLKPMNGIQEGTIKGSMCDKLEKCPACKSMFIPAVKENIQDLILFNRYLKEKREELEASSTHDWETTWLPYLVLTNEALGRLEKGDTAIVFQNAEKSVAGVSFAGMALAS